MGNRKKSKSVLHEEEDVLAEGEFSSVLELFAADLQEKAVSDLEPFESYLYTQQLKWCKDLKGSCARIEAGYRVLLKEVSP